MTPIPHHDAGGIDELLGDRDAATLSARCAQRHSRRRTSGSETDCSATRPASSRWRSERPRSIEPALAHDSVKTLNMFSLVFGNPSSTAALLTGVVLGIGT